MAGRAVGAEVREVKGWAALLAIITWVSERGSHGWFDSSGYRAEKKLKRPMRDRMGSQCDDPREGSWPLGPGCSDRRGWGDGQSKR